MRIFKRNEAHEVASWAVEVNYGTGWFPYGPPLPERAAAEALARDLERHGHGVRVVVAQPEAPAPTRTRPRARTRPHPRNGRRRR